MPYGKILADIDGTYFTALLEYCASDFQKYAKEIDAYRFELWSYLRSDHNARRLVAYWDSTGQHLQDWNAIAQNPEWEKTKNQIRGWYPQLHVTNLYADIAKLRELSGLPNPAEIDIHLNVLAVKTEPISDALRVRGLQVLDIYGGCLVGRSIWVSQLAHISEFSIASP